MVTLYIICKSKHIQLKLKYNLYLSLVLSIITYGFNYGLSIEIYIILNVLYPILKKLQEFENKYHMKFIGMYSLPIKYH